MKIHIISPKWEKFKHWPFHMSLLGPLTVAGLTPETHEISYIDENVQPVDESVDADVILISAMTVQAQRGYELAEIFRKREIPVLMGGLHATLLPEEVALHVDSVAVGEAELIWGTMLDDLQHGVLKKYYRAAGLADMFCDGFCHPKRDLLRPVGYTKTMTGQRVIDTIQAGRGCARNCPDCNVPLVSGRRFRPRKIDDVLSEIAGIDAKFMFFVDDSIPECREYFLELFREMSGMGKQWMSVGALHLANDPELLEAMVRSGCRVLYIGFDRLDPSWREKEAANSSHDFYKLDIKKYDITFNQDYLHNAGPYYHAVSRIRDAGISIIGTFAFGFDADETTVFEKSLSFALESRIDLADFNIVAPYPRSPLARKLEKEERILSHDWGKYNGMHVVFEPKLMSPEQLLEGTEWAWQTWNRERPIFRNMIRVFGDKIK